MPASRRQIAGLDPGQRGVNAALRFRVYGGQAGFAAQRRRPGGMPGFRPAGNAEKFNRPIGNAAKLAEGVGFEPTNRLGLTVFKTAAIVHSAIPPGPLAVHPGWSTLRRRAVWQRFF